MCRGKRISGIPIGIQRILHNVMPDSVNGVEEELSLESIEAETRTNVLTVDDNGSNASSKFFAPFDKNSPSAPNKQHQSQTSFAP